MIRYKLYNCYRTKKEFINIIICNILKPAAEWTQNYINKHYNTESGEYEDYRGLCNHAVTILNSHIDISKLNIIENHKITIETIHGELHHDSRIPSIEWCDQHTMSLITIDGIKFYVDTTCKQFRNLYTEMPEYYVEAKCPDWFYPDKYSPVFGNKLGYWIDDHIKITHRDNEHVIHYIGIISYIQYFIHGRISDKIHKIKYKS